MVTEEAILLAAAFGVEDLIRHYSDVIPAVIGDIPEETCPLTPTGTAKHMLKTS